MNPRLIKFAVELQTGEKAENSDDKTKYISFPVRKKNIFNIYKTALELIPVNKD